MNVKCNDSDQSQVPEELGLGEELFYALFQNSPVGTLIIDEKTKLLEANQPVFRYFNRNNEPVKGQLFGNVFNCETVANSDRTCGCQKECQECLINKSLRNVVKTGENFADVELAHFFEINGRKDVKWFSVSATAIKHEDVNYAVVTLVDITERKHREETLALIGITDELTGMFNRRYIMAQIAKQCENKNSGATVVVMLDIDNFKHVNDKYGHLTGDLVLKSFAEIIKKNIRYSDFAGRYGGEEFLILLPGSDLSIGTMIIDRIHASLAEQHIDAISSPITFSAGIVEVAPDGENIDYEKVIAEADRLMYVAKVNGKNRNEVGLFKG